MMNVTKNQAFLIAGIAVIGLGVGAYFLFFRREKGAYNPDDANSTGNPTLMLIIASSYKPLLRARR